MKKKTRNILSLIFIGLVVFFFIVLFRACNQKKEPASLVEETFPVPAQSDTTVSVDEEVVEATFEDIVDLPLPPQKSIATPSRSRVLPKDESKSPIVETRPVVTENDIPKVKDDEIVESEIVENDITATEAPVVADVGIDIVPLPTTSPKSASPSQPKEHTQLSHVVFIGGGFTEFQIKDGDDPYYSVLRYNAGVAVDIPLSHTPAIFELGIRYIDRSSGEEVYVENEFESSVNYKYLHSLQCLDLFAKAKYDLDLGSVFSLQPYVGYAASILLNAHIEELQPQSGSIDAMDIYNSVYPLLLLGTDFLIYDKYSIGVEYDLGLSNIYFTGKERKAKSSAMFINMGYRF